MSEGSNIIVVNKADLNIEKRIRENYNALKPALTFEKYVGIFRFCLKNGKLQPPTWTMKLYSACLGVLYLTLFFIFLRIPAVIKGEEKLMNIIDDLPVLIHMFHYITSMASTSFLLSKCNMEILINVAELDDQLLKTNDDKLYSKFRSKNIKALILFCLSHAILFALDLTQKLILHFDNVIILMIIAFPVFVIQKLETMVFCLFVTTLKSRVILINGYLATFLEENNINTVFTISGNTKTVKGMNNMIGPATEGNTKIRDLAMMFHKLSMICAMTNRVYNFQMLMSLASTFVHIVIVIWISLYTYRSDNSSGPLVTVLIWCFMSILSVSIMCFVCENLRFVRNTTKVLVNQIIMDYELPKTMRVQAKAFMELIDAWPLRIYIYDMFCVDITLMLKFISVATTYLIIIIQVFHFT